MTYQDFIMALNADKLSFVENINDYLINNGCAVAFEEKKQWLFGSYKHGKIKKALVNFFIKKQGLFVRIYGENLDAYCDFLNTLPVQMVKEIDETGICKRLVSNGCSPKCIGYDFIIDSKRFQKCRYGCFEFLVTDETGSYIKTFIENELNARE